MSLQIAKKSCCIKYAEKYRSVSTFKLKVKSSNALKGTLENFQ